MISSILVAGLLKGAGRLVVGRSCFGSHHGAVDWKGGKGRRTETSYGALLLGLNRSVL